MPRYLSSSATAGLTVVSVEIVLVGYTPKEVKGGESFYLKASLRNNSTVTAYYQLRLVDRDTGEQVWIAPGVTRFDPGATVTTNIPLTMPNKDWHLRLDLLSAGTVFKSFNIDITLLIPTSIDLKLSKTTVGPGEEVTASGTLSWSLPRAGGPLANATVSIYLNGTKLADVKTDSYGRFSYTFRAPVAPGTYTIKASFGGMTLSKFMPSEAEAKLYVGIPFIPPEWAGYLRYIATLAPFATLIGVISYNEYRKVIR